MDNTKKLKLIFSDFPECNLTFIDEKRAVALCPFSDHEEITPSFKIKVDEEKWKCFGCDRGGTTFDYLMRELDITDYSKDTSPVSLPVNTRDYSYLISRGISVDTQISCGVVTTKERIYFPSYSKNGKLIYYSSRFLDNRSPKYINKGSIKNPYLINMIHGDKLYVTEGAIDTLSIIDQGFESIAVISGYLKRKPAKVKLIILGFDKDKAGENKTVNTIVHLIIEKEISFVDIRVIDLPDGKDINQLHMDGINISSIPTLISLDYLCKINDCVGSTEEDVLNKKSFLSDLFFGNISPKKYQAMENYTIRETLEYTPQPPSMLEILKKKEAYDNLPINTYDYVFEPLINKNVKGGRVIICCAPSGVGKTTLLLNIISKNIMCTKYKQLFLSLDMCSNRLLDRLDEIIEYNHDIDYLNSVKKEKIESNTLVLTAEYCPLDAKDFVPWFDEYIKANPELRVIFIDHMEQLPTTKGHQNHVVQATFMRDMSEFSKTHDIDIYLLAQSTKESMASINKYNTVPSFKGAAAIFSLADMYFQMDKYILKNKTVLKDIIQLSVLKNRDGSTSYESHLLKLCDNGVITELNTEDRLRISNIEKAIEASLRELKNRY